MLLYSIHFILINMDNTANVFQRKLNFQTAKQYKFTGVGVAVRCDLQPGVQCDVLR